ncbi:hypothetical protein E0L36_11090 [Streptomyces sp. AJS327]|uniref:hypothetical protein n=1 Tax=Streptomyces sp. AJS327 TaxID=2545265 RepID=UPI0015DE26B8|nr:hypothetical protein [Streptomyces sp. AJS327]MBA0051415.1 hypothetical protein [Streptomyces sp. AJS327]
MSFPRIATSALLTAFGAAALLGGAAGAASATEPAPAPDKGGQNSPEETGKGLGGALGKVTKKLPGDIQVPISG